MGIKQGLEAVLYYDAAGVANDTWTALEDVKDLSLNIEGSEADVTTRGSGGWRQVLATLKDASIEWGMEWDTADAGFTAIKDAFFNKTPIGLAIMDSDMVSAGADAHGLKADFAVVGFKKEEPLEGSQNVNVTVKPTYSATKPAFVHVTVPAS